MNMVKILGIPFHALTVDQTLEKFESFLATKQNHIIVTPNPEGVMQARRNPALSHALQSATLSLADGIGIIIAARLKRLKLPGRVRGFDIVMALFERLDAKQGGTVYLLGAAPGVAERAAENIEKRYPAIKVIGHHHGFFDDDEPIIAEISRLSPDIVIAGMGMPRQELWAIKNSSISTRITLCVGGTIDVLAGEVKLAPAFMRKMGLEWLYRLVNQPSRAKRMLDLPRFMLAVIFSKGI